MFPTGLFVAALPKTVAGGQYKYADSTIPTQVFTDHNINQVEIQFEGQNLFFKDPNPGMIGQDVMDIKSVVDHMEILPLASSTTPICSTTNIYMEKSATNPFPHVYISLCQNGNQGSIVPHNTDGKILNRPGQLDVKLTLGTGGNKDVTFFMWLFYRDIVYQFDIKNRQFVPYYGTKRSII